MRGSLGEEQRLGNKEVGVRTLVVHLVLVLPVEHVALLLGLGGLVHGDLLLAAVITKVLFLEVLQHLFEGVDVCHGLVHGDQVIAVLVTEVLVLEVLQHLFEGIDDLGNVVQVDLGDVVLVNLLVGVAVLFEV